MAHDESHRPYSRRLRAQASDSEYAVCSLSNQATHHSQHAANSHGVRRSHYPWIFSVFENRFKRPAQTLPISYAGPEDPALNECREARWALPHTVNRRVRRLRPAVRKEKTNLLFLQAQRHPQHCTWSQATTRCSCRV